MAQDPVLAGEVPPNRVGALESEKGIFVHTHHGIDYIEFKVRDVATAKAFYASAFGWAFTDYGPDYSGIQGPDREVGGLAKGTPRPSGGPLVVLYSKDLEATAKSVLDAGGSIVREAFEFPGGRRFHFSDPSGNELGVWSDN
jgi:predicted enzyme related to lactoylglutathione lyase